jgi:hypothetical protein
MSNSIIFYAVKVKVNIAAECILIKYVENWDTKCLKDKTADGTNAALSAYRN